MRRKTRRTAARMDAARTENKEYSVEDSRGEANRTAVRTAAARRRTPTANPPEGTTSAVDVVAVVEKQGRSWR